MSIVSVDNIQPIGSGTTVTVNKSVTLESGNTNITGVCTATSFSGSGANLTNLPSQVTITGNADNRVITGGSGTNLNGESLLTFDGNKLLVASDSYNILELRADENNDGGNDDSIIQFTHDGTLRAEIRYDESSSSLELSTADNRNDLVIDSSGNVEISDGNLILASGHGIDFSATGDGSGSMTSELLDDYEEGSFTPQFDGLSNTPAYAVRSGRYTKVGRLVHITGIMQAGGTNPTFTTTSDILKITGLPYAGFGVMYYVSLGNVSHQGWNCIQSGNNEQNYSSGDIDFMNCQMEHNTAKMLFIAGKSGNSRARIRNSSAHNQGFIIMFELSYTTA